MPRSQTRLQAIRRNKSKREQVAQARRHRIEAESTLQTLRHQANELQQRLHVQQQKAEHQNANLVALSESIEMLKVENASLAAKNEFLASGLRSIRRRELLQEAVQLAVESRSV